MELVQPLSGGMRGTCRTAWLGHGFPASEPDAPGTPRPRLTDDHVRIIDALVRAAERQDRLRAMHDGDWNKTLRDAVDAGGLRDAHFALAEGAAFNDRMFNRACFRGHLGMVDTLLNAHRLQGPFVRELFVGGLYEAAAGGQTACCALLLDRGGRMDTSASWALYFALERGRVETAAFLLTRSEIVPYDEGAIRYALQAAQESEYDNIVPLLLARHAGEE